VGDVVKCFEYKLVNSVDWYTQLTSQLSVPVLVNSVDQLTPKLVNSVDTQKKDIKEKKETIVSSGGGDEKTNGKAPNKDPNFGTVCTAYEQNIGLLTSNIGESIEGLLYEDNIPAEWIVDAIRVACESEKRSLAYVKGILKRWKREGKTLQQFADSKKIAPALAAFTGSEK
jgi:DnaD/phage-associated family protein